MPLVVPGTLDGDLAVTASHARARKIKPQLSEGPLVRVAGGRHQAEAELIQSLLLEEGVPSLIRRARGFDVPDMLAAGPRDVLVPRSGLQTAREVLLQSDLADQEPRGAGQSPLRLLLGVIAAFAVVALVAWLGTVLLV
jgi:hypothetical protein